MGPGLPGLVGCVAFLVVPGSLTLGAADSVLGSQGFLGGMPVGGAASSLARLALPASPAVGILYEVGILGLVNCLFRLDNLGLGNWEESVAFLALVCLSLPRSLYFIVRRLHIYFSRAKQCHLSMSSLTILLLSLVRFLFVFGLFGISPFDLFNPPSCSALLPLESFFPLVFPIRSKKYSNALDTFSFRYMSRDEFE